MTLSKREKVLVLVVGVLGAIMLVVVISSMIVTPIQTHYKDLEAAQKQIEDKELDLKAAKMAQKKMEDWRPRSLPGDAQGVYNDKLIEWATATFPFKVEAPSRTVAKAAAQPGQRTGIARASFKVADYTLHYKLEGQGSLKQLVAFLYQFYSAGYLHQIRSMEIKPAEKSSDLKVTLQVDILSLPDPLGTPPRTGLPKVSGPAKKPEATLAVYEKDIGERNPFAPFTQPVIAEVKLPPPAPPPPKFEVSKWAMLTMIVTVDGQPEARVFDRTSGTEYRLHPGDPITLGTFKGTVGRIGEREVEFLITGGSDPIRVALGEPLRRNDESASAPSGAPPGSADAKGKTAVALSDKGKSGDPPGKASGDADSSKDSRGKGGRTGAASGNDRKKGNFNRRKRDDQKSDP